MMKSGSISIVGKTLLAFAVALGILPFTMPQAHAQSFSVVHNFTGGSDGGNPLNGFVAGANGILYGTASSGGSSSNGVVLAVSPNGTETVVHQFAGGKDGSSPQGALIADKAGNLYGTTAAGGTNGLGTVFMITLGAGGLPPAVFKSGAGPQENVLYSFAGQADGAGPQAGLAFDSAGNLYGTTAAGGTSGNGTVFKLAAPSKQGGTWTETVLYSFGKGTDGSVPVSGVSLDAAGNLYGTASAGGTYGYGTVFQLTPGATWTENILHNFQDGNDGAVPYAGLVADQSGNFYGAATEGGANGGGTVFKLTFSGGNWTFNVIDSVPGWGISGSFRNVVLDSSGNLFATTHCDGNNNSGTVYELTPSGNSWNYKLLYTFTGGSDGMYSFSNLVMNQDALYGTTKYGGSNGDGVIFKVTP